MTEIDINAAEEEIAEILNPAYAANPTKFLRALAIVKHANRHTRPQFPKGIVVSNIPTIPEDQIPDFKEKYISNIKLKDYNSPEAKDRLQRNGRIVQYVRWNWALENIDTYMNMLRVSGHSDTKIQDMLEGIPMCLTSRDAFDELRHALKELAEEIEEEMEWSNVGFIFTGSSVPGFSQNPMKGFKNLPSRITSTTKSDVDICITGDGINNTVALCHSDGDEFLEPKRAYPTTISELSSGMRFGCKNIEEFCKSAARFHALWNEKLPGGLQFTFCEDDTDIPPWEARINIKDI